MNILINTNSLLTAAMLEKYLLRHSMKARVEAVGPLDPARAGMEVAIYFAENLSTVPLIEFLQKAEGSSPFVKKMLFAKSEEAALFGSEIRALFDEVVDLPVNVAVLVEKLTALCPQTARAAMAAPGEAPALLPAVPPVPPPREETPVKPIVTAYNYTLGDLAAQSGPGEPEDPYAGLMVPGSSNTPASQEAQILSALPEPETAPLPAAGELSDSAASEAPPSETTQILSPLPGPDSAPLPAAGEPLPPAAPATPAAMPVPESSPPPAAQKKQRPAKTGSGKAKPQGLKRVFSVAGKVLTALMLVLVLMMILLVVSSRRNKESPWIFGYTYYVVYTGSMKGTQPDSFDAGSLIIVKKIDPAQVEVGDIITFNRANEDAKLTTHRVMKISTDANGKRSFITKGDANAGPDDAPVTQDIVRGVVVGSVQKLGKFILFAQTKAGMLYFVYIPAGAIVLYEVFVFTNDWFARKKAKGQPGGSPG